VEWGFSEDEMRRPTPYAVPLGSAKAIRALLLEAQMKGGSAHDGW
jgi:transposase